MSSWEYEVFDWAEDSNFKGISETPGLKAKLNDLGNERWEVVAVEHIWSQGTSSFILKRAILSS